MTEEMKAKSLTGWCVLRFDAGDHRANTTFVSFAGSEGEARQMAERQALVSDGVTFMVFQKFGSAVLEHKVAWKGIAG